MTVQLIGRQEPTYRWVPAAWSYDSGHEAVEFSASCGLVLDPWQAAVTVDILGEEQDGSWTVNEAGIIVGRQNGKGGIIEARELAGIFLFGETLILHSAHQQRTSTDAFRRMQVIVESSPDLDRKVMAISRSKTDESITFKVDGRTARIRYLTRTEAGGRGLTKADLVVMDEAMILDEGPIASLLPILATAPRWQVIYAGSAGDKRLPTGSRVLARIRRRGLRKEPRVSLHMWEAHLRHGKTCHVHPAELYPVPECVRCQAGEANCTLANRADPDVHAMTNPSLGGRMKPTFLQSMMGAMATWDFDREFLGAGDYPDDDGWNVVPAEVWAALGDPESKRGPAFAVGIEVAWDGESASVSIMARRDDGLFHMEALESAPGTAWTVPYAKALQRKRPVATVVDPKSPSAVILPGLEEAGVKRIIRPTLPQYASWSARALQMVTETREVRHIRQPTMDTAVRVAKKRDLGQGTFAWQRENLTGDGTPWIAGTLALGGLLVNGSRSGRRPLVASSQRVNPDRPAGPTLGGQM